MAAAERYRPMTQTLESLQRRMQAAAKALDFEDAQRLREMIELVRGGATPEEAEEASAAGTLRQRPGAMGLGTGQERVAPPPGWTPPRKPDPLTARRGSRRR